MLHPQPQQQLLHTTAKKQYKQQAAHNSSSSSSHTLLPCLIQLCVPRLVVAPANKCTSNSSRACQLSNKGRQIRCRHRPTLEGSYNSSNKQCKQEGAHSSKRSNQSIPVWLHACVLIWGVLWWAYRQRMKCGRSWLCCKGTGCVRCVSVCFVASKCVSAGHMHVHKHIQTQSHTLSICHTLLLQDEGSAPQGYNISEMLLLARSTLINHRVAAMHMLAAVLVRARPSPLDVGAQVCVRVCVVF